MRDSYDTATINSFFSAAGLSCALLLRSEGLGRATRFLLDMLRQPCGICRINIGCTQLSGKKFFVPLTDTDPKGIEMTRIPGSENPFSIIAEDRISEPVIINNLENYKKEALLLDQSVRELPFFQHKALLRLPLFRRGELLFWIDFWSDMADHFVESDVQAYERLLEPCKDDLQEALGIDPTPKTCSPSNVSAWHMISGCPGLEQIRSKIQKVASTNANVLVLGESGSGKELVAEAIHALSNRANGPLVKINCGAFTESLLESELFGAEKGAYTGSAGLRRGYFEYASGGTLFLDEIGEMPPNAQVRLLRALDSHVIQRVGSPREIPVNVRIIAATNRKLKSMVSDGMFRKDLLYRLNVYPVNIPPLRKRREDILPLVHIILRQKITELGLHGSFYIPHSEHAKLLSHDWPGNVRELANVIERSLILHGKRSGMVRVILDETCEYEGDSGDDNPLLTLEELEKQHIGKVLDKTNGRLSGPHGAAQILGIHYTTLRAKIQKYAL